MARILRLKDGEKYRFVVGQKDIFLIMRELSHSVYLESDDFSNVELRRSDTIDISKYKNEELRILNKSGTDIYGELQLSEVDIRIKEQKEGGGGDVVVDEILTPVIISSIQTPVKVILENEIIIPDIVIPEIIIPEIVIPEIVIPEIVIPDVVIPDTIKSFIVNDILKVQVINPDAPPPTTVLKKEKRRNLFLNSKMRLKRDGRGTGSVDVGLYGFDRWRRSSLEYMRQPILEGNYTNDKAHVIFCTHRAPKIIISPSSGNWDNSDLDIPLLSNYAFLEEGEDLNVDFNYNYDYDYLNDVKMCSMYYFQDTVLFPAVSALAYLRVNNMMHSIPSVEVKENLIFTESARGTSLHNYLLNEKGFCLINRRLQGVAALGADYILDAEIYDTSVLKKKINNDTYIYSDELRKGVFSSDYKEFIPRNHDFWICKGIDDLEKNGLILEFKENSYD